MRHVLPMLMSRRVSLFVPAIILMAVFSSYSIDKEFFINHMVGEWGFVENTAALTFFLGGVFGSLILKDRRHIPLRWVRAYFLLYTLGCFFVFAEEISYGQHYFGWDSPEYLQEVNVQKETNLHNITPLLDRVPRSIIEGFVIIVGVLWVIYALFRRLDYNDRNDWKFWIYPGIACLPAAIVAELSKTPRRIIRQFDLDIVIIPDKPLNLYNEVFEMHVGIFMLFYGAVVYHKLLSMRDDAVER